MMLEKIVKFASKFADLKIISSDQKVFYSHKIFLCIFSDFLTDVFLSEDQQDLPATILVPFEAQYIDALLDYIYNTGHLAARPPSSDQSKQENIVNLCNVLRMKFFNTNESNAQQLDNRKNNIKSQINNNNVIVKQEMEYFEIENTMIKPENDYGSDLELSFQKDFLLRDVNNVEENVDNAKIKVTEESGWFKDAKKKAKSINKMYMIDSLGIHRSVEKKDKIMDTEANIDRHIKNPDLDIQVQFNLNRNPIRIGWLINLMDFMTERKEPIKYCPRIGWQPIDLWSLHYSAMVVEPIIPGLQHPMEEELKWKRVLRHMKLEVKYEDLKDVYDKYVLAFKNYLQEKSNSDIHAFIRLRYK